MARDSLRTIIEKTREFVPGTAIAVAGLALAIFTSESNRMSSFQNVRAFDLVSPIALVVGALLLALLALAYRRKPALRLHRIPAVGFSVAGLLSLSFVCVAQLTEYNSGALYTAASLVGGTAKWLLLLFWVEMLFRFPMRQNATILAMAIGTAGVLNGLSCLVKQDAAVAIAATAPLLSIACLYWFKDKQESFDAPSEVFGTGGGAQRREVARLATKRPLGSYLVFLVPIPFFTFGYGFIHSAWIPLQDGSQVSVTIQEAAALGTILAMGMLLLLITYFWGPKKLELYPLLVLFVFGLMLYINAAFHEMLPALYVVALNIAQKITLFLALLSPFLVPVRHSSLGVAAAASALYTAGRFGSTMAVSTLDTSLHPVLLLGAVVIAGVSVVAGLMLNSGASEKPTAEGGEVKPAAMVPKKSEPVPTPQTEAGSELPATDPNEAQRRVAACDQLARSHGLTNRERETLYLLAQGMTATAIAEALTVSTYTVKSHIRSIYAKLEVHSRNELLVMIHRN